MAESVQRVEMAIIEAQLKYERFQPELVKYCDIEVEEGLERMQVQARERAEYLRQNAHLSLQKESVWDVIKMVGECLMSLMSIAMGLTLMYYGNPYIGVGLVFIGVLELCNLVFQKTGVWELIAKEWANENEDTEQKIKTYAPMVISSVAMVASIGSTLYTNDLSSTLFSSKQSYVIHGLIGSAQGVASVGGGICEGRMAKNEAEYEKVSSNERLTKSYVDQKRTHMEGVFAENFGSAKLASRTIKQTSDIFRRIISW